MEIKAFNLSKKKLAYFYFIPIPFSDNSIQEGHLKRSFEKYTADIVKEKTTTSTELYKGSFKETSANKIQSEIKESIPENKSKEEITNKKSILFFTTYFSMPDFQVKMRKKI